MSDNLDNDDTLFESTLKNYLHKFENEKKNIIELTPMID